MNENKLFNAIVSRKEFQFSVAFVIAFLLVWGIMLLDLMCYFHSAYQTSLYKTPSLVPMRKILEAHSLDIVLKDFIKDKIWRCLKLLVYYAFVVLKVLKLM